MFCLLSVNAAGLAVFTDVFTHQAQISQAAAARAVAIPVATYVGLLWLLQDLPHARSRATALGPMALLLILVTPLAPSPVLLTGAVLAGYLATRLIVHRPRVRA